jgi:hypothetical protein
VVPLRPGQQETAGSRSSASPVPHVSFNRFSGVLFYGYSSIITKINLKTPLLPGFAAYSIGQAILVLTPGQGIITYGMLGVSLVALHVDVAERARVMDMQDMLRQAVF